MQAESVIHIRTNANQPTVGPVSSTDFASGVEEDQANVLTIPGPDGGQRVVARGEALLPVAQASPVQTQAVQPGVAYRSNTRFENLPIDVVRGIIWRYVSDLPTMKAIEREFPFDGALAPWLDAIETRAAQDVAAFRAVHREGAPEQIWALSYGLDGNRRDYIFTGLTAHPNNRYWATQFDLPGTDRDIDVRAASAHRVDSLRIAMEVVLPALFSNSPPLSDHLDLLAAVDELYAGRKGFADPQGLEERARRIGVDGINFQRPAYSPQILNNIRMRIVDSAAEIFMKRLQRPGVWR